jgi:hypothetical protein
MLNAKFNNLSGFCESNSRHKQHIYCFPYLKFGSWSVSRDYLLHNNMGDHLRFQSNLGHSSIASSIFPRNCVSRISQEVSLFLWMRETMENFVVDFARKSLRLACIECSCKQRFACPWFGVLDFENRPPLNWSPIRCVCTAAAVNPEKVPHAHFRKNEIHMMSTKYVEVIICCYLKLMVLTVIPSAIIIYFFDCNLPICKLFEKWKSKGNLKRLVVHQSVQDDYTDVCIPR